MTKTITTRVFFVLDQQIGQLLFRDIQFAFFSFINKVLTDCEINPGVAHIPVQFNKPIYGDQTPNFTDFAAPGVILTIIFFLSVALTSGAMLIERNEGMLERCLVSGITGIELLFSHVVTQFVIMCGQTTFVLIFSFSIFGLTLRGDILWVILLTVLTGLCGMCFGKLSFRKKKQNHLFFSSLSLYQILSYKLFVYNLQVLLCHQLAKMNVLQHIWQWEVSCRLSCCAELFGRLKECTRV